MYKIYMTNSIFKKNKKQKTSHKTPKYPGTKGKIAQFLVKMFQHHQNVCSPSNNSKISCNSNKNRKVGSFYWFLVQLIISLKTHLEKIRGGLASSDINTYYKASIIKSKLPEQKQTNQWNRTEISKQTHTLLNIIKWSIASPSKM